MTFGGQLLSVELWELLPFTEHLLGSLESCSLHMHEPLLPLLLSLPWRKHSVPCPAIHPPAPTAAEAHASTSQAAGWAGTVPSHQFYVGSSISLIVTILIIIRSCPESSCPLQGWSCFSEALEFREPKHQMKMEVHKWAMHVLHSLSCCWRPGCPFLT